MIIFLLLIVLFVDMSSIPIPKNVHESLTHSGWGAAMEEEEVLSLDAWDLV